MVEDHGERISRLEVSAEHTTEAIRELRSDVRDLRSDLHGFRAEVRSEFQSLRAEFQGELREIRRELALNFRVMVSIQMGTFAAILALFARAAHWL